MFSPCCSPFSVCWVIQLGEAERENPTSLFKKILIPSLKINFKEEQSNGCKMALPVSCMTAAFLCLYFIEEILKDGWRCAGFDHDTAVLASSSLAKTSWGLHGWLLPSVSCEMIWWFGVVFLWEEFLFNKKTPVKKAFLLIVRGARDWIDDGNCISFSSCSCQHCVKNRAGLNSGKQLCQILNFLSYFHCAGTRTDFLKICCVIGHSSL